ncbi:MAG: hypothetical protein GXO95_00760 [Nitrospirae bacterium]|nr:hypothetical protein [Nitrospirota bacterium]
MSEKERDIEKKDLSLIDAEFVNVVQSTVRSVEGGHVELQQVGALSIDGERVEVTQGAACLIKGGDVRVNQSKHYHFRQQHFRGIIVCTTDCIKGRC